MQSIITNKRSHLWVNLCAIALTSCLASLSAAREISGSLQLSGSDARTVNLTDAIVYFIPDDKSQMTATAGEYQIAMARKQFVPRTMAVPVGSVVHIPNNDSISHNAFSPSTPSNFDLELYGRGDSKSFSVHGPGVVRIYCNVHYHMVAYVLGLETPYYTQPDSKGNFRLTAPDVAGQLVIWHERTNDYVQALTPGGDKVVDAKLRITKRRLPVHNNKFGHGYRRQR